MPRGTSRAPIGRRSMTPRIRNSLIVLSGLLASAVACGEGGSTGTTTSAGTGTDDDGGTNNDGAANGGNGGSATMPAALMNRITELNSCQSRLQQTKRTYPVQDIQAEAA